MSPEDVAAAELDWTLPGHPSVELRPGGAQRALSAEDVPAYCGAVARCALLDSVPPQGKHTHTLAFSGRFLD